MDRDRLRNVVTLAAIAMTCAAATSCNESIPSVFINDPVRSSDTTTVPLGGTVDITDGIRYFRNVQVYGTLTYHTNFFDDLERAQEVVNGGRVGVFLSVQLWFKRLDDYQGVSQNWHAGGKSYEVLELQPDGTAMTYRQYQLWGVEGTAFVNTEFLIQRSDVRLHSIWISYEYPD